MRRALSLPGWILLLSVWLAGSLPALAQTTVNTENSAGTDKVYGQPDCQNGEKIAFTWSFTPEGQSISVKDTTVKYWIILGSSDRKAEAAVVLQEGSINAATLQPDSTTGTLQVKGEFNGTPDTGKEDTDKGMFDDGVLNIRDVIGYYRTQTEQQPAPSATTVCKLESAQKSGERSVEIYISVEYYASTLDNPHEKKTGSGSITVTFDLAPPPAPDAPSLFASERSLKVSWSANTDSTYDIYYSKTQFTPATALQSATRGNSNPISGSSFTLSNLTNGLTYYVAIREYDKAGNPGDFSSVVSEKPVELSDFYEKYRSKGGADQGFSGGSYCFLATAAYGAYDHRYVKLLRAFRDRYLQTNRPGRAFVRWYYRLSPPLANWIRQHPTARRLTQIALLPLIAMSAFFLYAPFWSQLLLGLLLALALGMGLRRWRYRRLAQAGLVSRTGLASFVAALLFLGATVPAQATSSPRNFGLEFRLGAYRPQIDEESALKNKSASPYQSFFGNNSQLYLEISGEWLFFKLFGTLGLSGSVGFTWAEAQAQSGSSSLTIAQTADSTTNTTTNTTENKNNTGLWILPLRLGLVYRLDYFAQKYSFPLVPYVRGGLDYFFWWVTTPNGSIASARDPQSGKCNTAFGGRFGFHFAAGLQFLLDILEPTTARNFDLEVGVNHTYIFAEWHFTWVGTLNPGLNLSDSSFRAGLMFQF